MSETKKVFAPVQTPGLTQGSGEHGFTSIQIAEKAAELLLLAGLASACAPQNPTPSPEQPVTPPPTTEGKPTASAPPPTGEATIAAVATATPAPEVTATPMPSNQPSMFEGLNYGSYGTQDGAPVYVGAVSGEDIENSINGFKVPSVDGAHESRVNTLYNPDFPDAPAGFGIDSKFIASYFSAEPEKDGVTRGILPNGQIVEQRGLLWMTTDAEGKELVMNPFVMNRQGQPFGYPVLLESADGTLHMALVDANGALIEGQQPKPAFRSPGEIAADAGFQGDANSVRGVALGKNGVMNVTGENGQFLGEVDFTGKGTTFEEWVQSSQPEGEVFESAKARYAETMGLSGEGIQTTVEVIRTSHGPLAVVIDTATGTPLLMSGMNAEGGRDWVAFTFDNITDLNGKRVGVEALGGSGSNRQTIIANEFNQMHITAMSWARSQPSENETVVTIPQSFLEKAVSTGETPTFAALVYGNSTDTPDWLRNGNYSREDAIRIMQNHITTVMQSNRELYNRLRGQGKVKEEVPLQYIVVNEGVNEPGYYWPGKIGPEYIEIAFQTARTADPDAVLIYNDFGHELPAGRNANGVFEVVSNLKSKGLIDGVGMQMHFIGGPDNLNPNMSIQDLETGIRQQIDRYGQIGVPVFITEMDVDLAQINGTTEEKMQKAAEIYRMIARIAADNPNCVELSVYGLSNEGSWISDLGGEPALLFADNEPLPTFYAALTGYYEGFKSTLAE